MIASEIMLPPHAPEIYLDRATLWNAVENCEKHPKAQLAYSFDIAMQNELTLEENMELEKQGLSLPTADEWAYLCGGGCRTLFPWGDGLDYSMRLHWFENMDEDENRPYDMEEPNFFGLSIAYDPYMREVVQADRLLCDKQTLKRCNSASLRLLPHRRSRPLCHTFRAFRHKQDSTLVAEQTAISSIFAFFVSIYSVFVERPG